MKPGPLADIPIFTDAEHLAARMALDYLRSATLISLMRGSVTNQPK